MIEEKSKLHQMHKGSRNHRSWWWSVVTETPEVSLWHINITSNQTQNKPFKRIWLPTFYQLTSGSVLVHVMTEMINGTAFNRLEPHDTRVKRLSGDCHSYSTFMLHSFLLSALIALISCVIPRYEGALPYFIVDIRRGRKKTCKYCVNSVYITVVWIERREAGETQSKPQEFKIH